MRCLKQVVQCVIKAKDGSWAKGVNRCSPQLPKGSNVCPRVTAGCKTGDRHELCNSTHAEIDAIVIAKSIGMDMRGATAIIYGHSYVCADCTKALEAEGVVSIKVANAPHFVLHTLGKIEG